MAYGKGVRVSNCPIKLEVCFPSCYFRKGGKCYFSSKRGRRVTKIRPQRR